MKRKSFCDIRGQRNKVWRISSKLSSRNTEGRTKRVTRQNTIVLFGTGESENVYLNSFQQVKKEQDARVRCIR